MGQPQLYVLRFGMRALPGRGAAAAAAAAATAPTHRRMRNYSMHFILYSFPPDGDATQYQHTQTHREKRNNLQK